jgi:hypothetical protein
MAVERLVAEQTWRLLWSHAAYQVISSFPPDYERVEVGYGWGLRNRANPQHALLIHPTGSGREAGDLSLTVRGSGAQVLPRCGLSYTEYLESVADIVETTARVYFDE